jgi:glycerol-3-phosphate dehydrogenase
VHAEVIWAVRHEMARTIEDVLARRMRALFLNARAALEMAPTVAELMAGDLGWTAGFRETQLKAFDNTAKNYVLSN